MLEVQGKVGEMSSSSVSSPEGSQVELNGQEGGELDEDYRGKLKVLEPNDQIRELQTIVRDRRVLWDNNSVVQILRD